MPASDLLGTSIDRRDLHGHGLLAPGFVDAQVNGGGGAFSTRIRPPQGPPDRRAHRRFGTTGLLPTVITDRERSWVGRQGDCRPRPAASPAPGILGIHIEGPFIDPKRKGAHAGEYIRELSSGGHQWLASLDCGTVLITVAPNRPPADPGARRNGVIVSLGHSEATPCRGDEALAQAPGLHPSLQCHEPDDRPRTRHGRRRLADPDSFCGIIADGLHVDDAALKVALAAKPSVDFSGHRRHAVGGRRP